MSEDLEALASKLSLGSGVRVLAAHPCGLVALEKPTGILSHPNEDDDRKRSLIRGDYDYEERRFFNLADDGSVTEVYLVNRLDSATSGVILVSTQADILPGVIRAFEKGKVRKCYLAIVQGRPSQRPNVWADHLSVSAGPGRGRRVHGDGHLHARTEIQVLKSDANQLGLCLMRLWPITGRTHQLRYQCTMRGHPILGDANYGDFGFNRHFAKLSFAKRLFLHAHTIELPLFLEDKQITFKAESPVPEEFDLLMEPNKDTKSVTRFAVSPRAIAAAQRKRFGR